MQYIPYGGNSGHSRIQYKDIFIWFLTLLHFLKRWAGVFLCSLCIQQHIVPLWCHFCGVMQNAFGWILKCVIRNKRETLWSLIKKSIRRRSVSCDKLYTGYINPATQSGKLLMEKMRHHCYCGQTHTHRHVFGFHLQKLFKTGCKQSKLAIKANV